MGLYNFIDMTGEVYGKLTVKGRMPRGPLDNGSVKWLCLCECGNVVVLRRDKLLAGRDSCGCLKKQKPPKDPKPRGRPPKPKTTEAEEPTRKNQTVKPAPVTRNVKPRPFSIPNPSAGKAYGFTQTSKCKRCKKSFERPTGDWGYKIGGDFFCTYKCMRAEEKDKGTPKLKGAISND